MTRLEYLQREVARLRALVAEACNAAECKPLHHDGENIKRVWAARIGAIREAASGVSASDRRARTPRRPEQLVGALHDRVHRDQGPSRPARSVRVDPAVPDDDGPGGTLAAEAASARK